ncbi:MAG: ABC-F family ATP-binding cassette domain-containing protein [Streptosporangiaceae bacterium]
MNLVNLEAASKTLGSRTLLDRVSLGVAAGDAIGVVGRNGAGKTTLLAALAGHLDLDSGQATRARSARVGYLPQASQLTGIVRDVVLGSAPEHTWAADPRIRAVISALLPDVDLDADITRLSGGERRRGALAALLRGSWDLLLLDEPTNHLDIEAIRWLAGYLRQSGQAYVVVTHDRWFLDEVSDQTWEVADGHVHSYEGSYSAYVLARAERVRVAAAEDQRRRNLLRKELAWLRRGPPARTSKPKFRLAAASALIAGEPPPRDDVELARIAAARLGKTVLELSDVTVTAGGRALLQDVTWQLGPGERVGVLGPNGSGKTTLLQVLAGRLPVRPAGGGAGPVGTAPAGTAPAGVSVTGRVVRGATVRLGYLTQEPPPVDPGLRVLQAAQQVRGSVQFGRRELTASQLLERLGLAGERQWTPVGELSGGERRRLQLLMVLMAEPNVLLLDEPTNDLDIETLTELEDLLDGWAGSVVAVSHDRYFLERVTDHLVAVLDAKLPFLPGGVPEYLDRRAAGPARGAADGPAAAAGPAPSSAAGILAGPRPPRSGQARPGAAPATAGPSAAARQRMAGKEMARLERQLSRLTDTRAELESALARNAADYERLIELGAQLTAVQQEQGELEERWLTLAEEASP